MAPAEAQAAMKAEPPQDPAVVAAGEADKLFQQRCVVCHGASGGGDGPGASALTVKPRAFADATWQKGVTDTEIEKVILRGGAAVGKDPSMPPTPALMRQPEVLKALVAKVRGFARG